MLKIQARNLGPVAVLHLEGQVVSGETEVLRNVVRYLSTPASVVRLDLSGVTTIDAGGLGTILELHRQAEAKGIRFELMNVSKRIRTLLEMTRLDSVFRIAAGLEFLPLVASTQRAAAA